jgi:hypothetical protein
MDLASWIDGDKSEIVEMRGGEDDVGDMPTPEEMLGPIAMERPRGG